MGKKIFIFAVILLTFTSFSYGGGGIFQPYKSYPIVGSRPEAVAIGDVNGDGRNDVVMTTGASSNSNLIFVLLQNASGNLDPPISYPAGNGYSIDIGDVNHDGRKDIVVTANNGIGIFYQKTSGELNPMVFYPTQRQGNSNSFKVRIGDFNHDGLLDVVSLGWGSNEVEIFLQQEDGTLAPPATFPAQHGGYEDLRAADFNHDGFTDVIVMSGQLLLPYFSVLYQNNSGTFDPAVPCDIIGSGRGLAVGDVNGDGYKDIVVTGGGNRPESNISVFLQDSAGEISPPVKYPSYDVPESTVIADVNNDGREDIVVLHGGWKAMGVYLQNAQGSLVGEDLYSLPYASHYNTHGLAVGDINGDGSKDVVIADYNNGLVVLINNTPGVKPEIYVEPLMVDFGTVFINGTAEKTISIHNDGQGELLIQRLDGPAQPFKIVGGHCLSEPIPPSGNCTLTLRFAPTTIDSFSSGLKIYSNDLGRSPASVTLAGKSQTASIFRITASATGCAKIDPRGEVQTPAGSSQTFTIGVSEEGCKVVDVLVDGKPQGPMVSYTFSNLDRDHTIQAVGQLIIKAVSFKGGKISPEGYVFVKPGSDQTFTITPEPNYKIQGVRVDGVLVGAVGSYTFKNVSNHHSIEARFAPIQFTINATSVGCAGINPSGQIRVPAGSSQTFTITTSEGCPLYNVWIDGKAMGPMTSYTFEKVDKKHTIRAVGAFPVYAKAVTPGGTIRPTGTRYVRPGANLTFTMTPRLGYKIDDVKVDGVSQGAISTYTFTNIREKHSIEVSFAPIKLIVPPPVNK